MKLVYIKQRPGRVATYFGLDKVGDDGVSVHPMARQTCSPLIESQQTGIWVTGLNDKSTRIMSIADKKKREQAQTEAVKQREELESLLGFDLSAKSEFWLSYRIEVVTREKEYTTLDLDKAEDRLKYIVLRANNLVADDIESLNDPAYQGVNLYFHDPSIKTSRKLLLQEMSDDAGAIIAPHKRNQDKLFYWLSALGQTVNKHMSREDLYNVLSVYRKNIKTPDEYERFIDILKLDNEALQLTWVAKMAAAKRMLPKLGTQYTYNDTELGNSLAEVKTNLGLPSNAAILESLLLRLND